MVTFLFLEYYFFRNEEFYELGRFIATFLLLSLHDQIITQAVHSLNVRSISYSSKLSSGVDSVDNDRAIVFFDVKQNSLETKKKQQQRTHYVSCDLFVFRVRWRDATGIDWLVDW